MHTIKVRRVITFISLMIFPLTLNYFSPYLSVTGAFDGIVSGSVLLFIALLLTSIFFRRSWCSTICPVCAIADYSERINNKNVNRKKLRIIRYSIFTVWFSTLILGFVLSFKGITINPFYLTENLLSVDEPMKFIIYYGVLFILIVLTLVIGKRGACHSICWMSPFLVLGSAIGDKLNLPQLRINSNPEACISCSKCNRACPMSIDVMNELKIGMIQSYDCINCAECENVCPKNVLKLSVSQRREK